MAKSNRKLTAKLASFFKFLGPGFVTGASDDDPSGIATYSQAGATFGFGLIWTTLLTFPFMVVMQEMCGRIGMVTGTGLAGIIRKHYPRRILYFSVFLLLFANTLNIGADLGAMAAAAQLIIPLPFSILLLSMTLLTLLLEIFVSYRVYTKYLKWLALSLVTYVLVAVVVDHDWIALFRALVIPNISANPEYLLAIVAILGTTISPYLFFWQANQEAEEEVVHHKIRAFGWGRPHITFKDIRRLRFDTVGGMLFSNLIMFFIMISTASTIHGTDSVLIETAPQAAEALRPVAGEAAFLLFAVGIIGTGMLAVPVLAGSASYALSEAFGWKEGLYRKFSQAHGFYGVITLATVAGLMVNYLDIKPFMLLFYTAVINGICAPPLMVIILRIANNEKIMGKHRNSRWSNITAITITALMTVAAGALIFTLLP